MDTSERTIVWTDSRCANCSRLTDAATVGNTSTPATEANRSAAHDAQYADQTSAAAAAVTARRIDVRAPAMETSLRRG